MESFNSRLEDDFLNIELFTSVQREKLLAELDQVGCKTYGPNSALQGRTPLNVSLQWKGARLPACSQKNGTSKSITSKTFSLPDAHCF